MVEASNDDMQKYMGGCKQFFEKVLFGIVLRQPTDPHKFLLEFLQNMSAEERAAWGGNMALVTPGLERPPKTLSSDAAQPPIFEGQLQVVLNLTLASGNEVKTQIMELLQDLRANAKAMTGCIHFEIYLSDDTEVLVLQTWDSQAALNTYHESTFFESATGRFAGLLAAEPDFAVYSHHKSL